MSEKTMIKFEENTAYWCKTEELANKLLKEADIQGFKYQNGDSYLSFNNWERYKEKTCYNIKDGYYCYKSHYHEKNYKIVEVTEEMFECVSEETNIAEDLTKHKTKANIFLDSLNEGYDELELHEMITIPKIKMQGIMQYYADQYAQEQVKEALEKVEGIISDRYMARQAEMSSISTSMKNSFIKRELSTLNYIEKTIKKEVASKYK